MMMKYEWKHFWGSFEKKAGAIFGESKDSGSDAINAVNSDAHQRAVQEMLNQ